jgi:hypothetical protein
MCARAKPPILFIILNLVGSATMLGDNQLFQILKDTVLLLSKSDIKPPDRTSGSEVAAVVLCCAVGESAWNCSAEKAAERGDCVAR